MQPKPTRKLNSQFAIDFHVPDEVSVDSGRARGFGRGYTLGAATGFCLVIGSFINIFISIGDATKVARGVGFLLISAGSSFVFVIGYQMVQRIGIRWSVDLLGRIGWSGVTDARRRPVRFWLSASAALIFFALFIAAGIWLCFHAAWVAKRLA